jgi:hypothetical protein
VDAVSAPARDRILFPGAVLAHGPALAVVLAALIAVASLFALADILLINPDTVQLMSTARNLLDGRGLSTSIIYYDPQYDAGGVPVPQTVWPPAYAFMLAAAQALGASPGAVAIAIGVLSHGLIALLVYAVLRHVGVRALVSIAAAVVWLLHTAEWYIVLAAYTEPFFIATTLLSAWCLLRAQGRGDARWLLAAGCAASLALLTRYTGVLWPFVVGLSFLAQALSTRTWRPIGRAILFGLPAALALAALLIRNYLLTGRFSGGQYEFGSPAGVVQALRHTYWEIEPLLGGALAQYPGVLALVMFFCGVGVVAAWLGLARTTDAARSDGAKRLMELSAGYAVVTILFLLVNAVLVSSGFLQYRYFVPAVPFALIVIALAVDHTASRAGVAGAQRRVQWLALLVALTIPAISLLADFVVQWPPVPQHPAVAVIEQALEEKLPNGQTLGRALATDSADRRPILAHHEHRVALLTQAPVYGLSDARFTRRVWRTADVEKLARERGIAQVLFFPTTYDARAPENANTPFFTELQSGRTPAWLHRRYASDLVWIYDVVDERS